MHYERAVAALLLALAALTFVGTPARAQAPANQSEAVTPTTDNDVAGDGLSAGEKTKKALAVYDRMRADDPYTLKSDRLDLELNRFGDCTGPCTVSPCVSPCARASIVLPYTRPISSTIQFEMEKSAPSPSSSNVYGPTYEDGRYHHGRESERKNRDAQRKIDETRQRTFEKVADSIAPGLGRVEFKIGSNNARLDYLYAKRCRVKGVGICLQVQFK